MVRAGPPTTNDVPSIARTDDPAAVRTWPPAVSTEIGGAKSVTVDDPITTIPAEAREIGTPETVTPAPPAKRVVPAIATADDPAAVNV